MFTNILIVILVGAAIGFGIIFILFFLEKKHVREQLSNMKDETDKTIKNTEETITKNKGEISQLIEQLRVDTEKNIQNTAKTMHDSLEEESNRLQEEFKTEIDDDNKGLVSLIREIDDTSAIKLNTVKESLKRNIANVEKDTKKEIQEVQTYYNGKIKELSELTENAVNESTEQVSKRIDELENLTEEAITKSTLELNQQIKALATVLEKINAENKELREKLQYFTDIKDESTTLNDDEDLEERERLIQKALEEAAVIYAGQSSMGKTDKTVDKATISIDLKKPVDVTNITEAAGTDIREADIGTLLQDDPIIKTPLDITEISVLDDEQNKAFEIMMNTDRNLFITGVAGTGKSFLIEVFVRFYKKNVLKMAPTGIAARNIEGVTLHSVFGYNNLEKTPLSELSELTLRLARDKKTILKEVNVFIIDEISMVRADILDKIDLILQIVNDNSIPFGGKQIIALGDLFQLPPIAKRKPVDRFNIEYEDVYFFNAHSYKDGNFLFLELTINHRQKDDRQFYEILNRMREGKLTDNDITILNSRIYNPEGNSPNRRLLTLLPRKDQVEEVNRIALSRISEKEYIYPAKITLNRTNNSKTNINSRFPINSDLRLKNGALVMMVNNDKQRRWANGKLGIISKLGIDFIKVMIDGVEYEVERVLFTEQEAVIENGMVKYGDFISVLQFPIVLAYAITIHKSQGQTYPKIACDISSCFASGQAYVALSRCTSLEGLHLLNEVTHDSVIIDPAVVDFYLGQKQTIS